MPRKPAVKPQTPTPVKKRTGPPTSFKPEYIDMIEVAMADGGSVVSLCAHIGCCEDTMRRWREENPTFDMAVNAALAKSHHWWQHVGKTALGNDKFNNTMYILQMRNRFKWLGKDPIGPQITVNANSIDEGLAKCHEIAMSSLENKT